MTEPAIHGGSVPSAGNRARRSVVDIVIYKRDGSGACTGTLISKRLVLTAAHCLLGRVVITAVAFGDNVDIGQAPTEWKFESILGATRVISSVEDPETTEVMPNRYLFQNADLALLQLPRDAPEGYEPVPLVTNELLAAAKTKKLFAMGYGIDEHGKNGKLKSCTLSDQIARAVEPDVAAKNRPYYFLCTNGQVDHGDSGGPLFAELDGKLYLYGLISGLVPVGTPKEVVAFDPSTESAGADATTRPSTNPTTQPEPHLYLEFGSSLVSPVMSNWIAQATALIDTMDTRRPTTLPTDGIPASMRNEP